MIKINMIPHERKKTSVVAVELVAAGSLLLVILVGIGIWWNHLDNTINEQKLAIEKKEKIVSDLQVIIDQVQKFEKDKQTLQNKLDTIQNLKNGQKGPVQLLDELIRRLPDQIWLANLRTAGNLVTIRGFALSQNSIGDFMGSLDTSPFFENITLKYSSLNPLKGVDVYEFELDFRTKV